MIRRFIALTLLLLLGTAVGCSTESDLGGVRIPNNRPETTLTGQPPSLLEAGFVCEFNWTGYDVDGEVVGYQWKISNNGNDGISPRDTMTVDPISGAVVNPWRYTTANDSVFYVLADQLGLPGDVPEDPRSFRTHTLFIRAVDNKGSIDPSPAHVSFTATTLLPTCTATWGGRLGGFAAVTVPPTLNIGYNGRDADFELNVPVRVRFLWVPALTPDGENILVNTNYYRYRDELIDFYDPDWTEWIEYEELEENRRATYDNLNHQDAWLFAVQVQDTAGAVSIGRDYQVEVGNVYVSEYAYAPDVTMNEVFLGNAPNTQPRNQVASGQPLNFSWAANATAYNGNIVSFQHGWNVQDHTSVTDPGWSIGPGLSDQNRYAEERVFTTGGLNYFFLKVVDDSDQEIIFKWTLDVISFVDYEDQFPLFVLDQINDEDSGLWTDRNGLPRDQQDYRTEYWRFLEGNDGVIDFSWDADSINDSDSSELEYSDIVPYKALVLLAKVSRFQNVLEPMRPFHDMDRFNFLAPYQRQGGNLFLVGESSMDSFIEVKQDYYVPTIFNTTEAPRNGYETSFGEKELPDGTIVARGPLQYPYATAGIAALDWTASGVKTIYLSSQTQQRERFPQCVGLKALSLDSAFKSQHLIGPGALADTINTNPIIDWHDYDDRISGDLELTAGGFIFGQDEFVDGNTTNRSTPMPPQECDLGPNGLCVEPMYRGIARFDWLREIRWAEGEVGWPYSRYSHGDLVDDYCGTQALAMLDTLPDSRARTNGQTFGWMSYKMVRDKASGKPDVYWGFDPYRFDEDDTQQAILWVMDFFGLELK
jgi:hypothetical protein